MTERSFVEEVRVGVVQTTLDARRAWPDTAPSPRMSAAEDSRAWHELQRAMRSLLDGNEKPRIVLLPELALPRTRLNEFSRLVASLNVIAFVGVDYRLESVARVARNEGVVFVPRGFWLDRPARYCARVPFGKAVPAPRELEKLTALRPSWSFSGDSKVYVFDAEQYGQIGVSICYDFMDIERALMYRGRIHHLFVIAYNRDLGMFHSLAESLSRTVFCNVVVCNTGYYGGSVAVAPYFDAYRRKVYAHDGEKLFTTQVVRLPVAGLHRALIGHGPEHSVPTKTVPEFKQPPPGVDGRLISGLSSVKLMPD